MKTTACLVSRATRRAEKRSVIRHTAFGSPRTACGNPGVGMADDGLRPLPYMVSSPFARLQFGMAGTGCCRISGLLSKLAASGLDAVPRLPSSSP
nr:hypothetical protein [Thioalkalivibrio paradoxus]